MEFVIIGTLVTIGVVVRCFGETELAIKVVAVIGILGYVKFNLLG